MGGDPYGDWLCGILVLQTMSRNILYSLERSAYRDITQKALANASTQMGSAIKDIKVS